MDVAELADTHDSGSCTRKGVEVQVLSSARNRSIVNSGSKLDGARRLDEDRRPSSFPFHFSVESKRPELPMRQAGQALLSQFRSEYQNPTLEFRE